MSTVNLKFPAMDGFEKKGKRYVPASGVYDFLDGAEKTFKEAGWEREEDAVKALKDLFAEAMVKFS